MPSLYEGTGGQELSVSGTRVLGNNLSCLANDLATKAYWVDSTFDQNGKCDRHWL